MLYDNDTFEHRGRKFTVTFPQDEHAEAPWEACEGHGPVSDWTTRSKRAGERELHSDGRSYRYYDFAEAVRIAKRDKWDAEPFGQGTAGERATRAVEADFERLRHWCLDFWCYVGVVVTYTDANGDECSESLWGIESDCQDYLEEVAHELAEQISSQLDDAMAHDIAASRPDMQPQHNHV
jgi:hypothetical protein